MTNYKVVVVHSRGSKMEYPLGLQESEDAAVMRAISIACLNGWGHAYQVREVQSQKRNIPMGWYVCNSFGEDRRFDSAREACMCLYKEAPDFINVTSVDLVAE